MISDCCSAPIYGEITGTGPDACGICSECKEWAGVYDESMVPCPACGTLNDDDWPITVNGKGVDGGCVSCWEKECDVAWWKMVTSLNKD